MDESNQKEIYEYSKEDIQETPRDTQGDGVISNIEKKTSREVFGDKAKFGSDNMVLVISYETPTGNGQSVVNYFENGKVPSNSKLGKLINRYGELKIGTKVRIQYNHEGYSRLIDE